MEVDYLVLADAAATADGKQYIHGAGWDTLWTVRFPVTHPSITAAIRLRVPWNETNETHQVEFDIVDVNGWSLLPELTGPIAGEINGGPPPSASSGDNQYICLALNILGLEFQRPGTYTANLRIDGTDMKSTSFRVALAPGIQSRAAIEQPGQPGQGDAPAG